MSTTTPRPHHSRRGGGEDKLAIAAGAKYFAKIILLGHPWIRWDTFTERYKGRHCRAYGSHGPGRAPYMIGEHGLPALTSAGSGL